MLNFSKSKIISIIAICFLAIIYAIPSFIPRDFKKSDSAFLNKLVEVLPSQKVNLGLDLRGGSHLMMEVDFDYYLKEQLTNLKDEIKESFREKSIRTIPIINDSEISFSLPDMAKLKEVKKIIKNLDKRIDFSESSGKFRVYFPSNELDVMRRNLVQQSIEIIRRRVDENGTKEPTIQAQGKNRILLQVPGIENSGEIKDILGKTAKMTFHFVSDDSFSSKTSKLSLIDPELERLYDDQGRAYLIKKEVVLSGDLLIDASPTYHEGEPAVSFRFNNLGSRKFAKITKNNVGKFFAIVLDGKIVTAPRINSVINQGSGVISGNFTTAETAQVALLLRAGALPAPLEIIEERTVGPSLGKDSIESGTSAAITGLILVAFFMVLFYGFFGVVANIALFFNIAAILSILSMVGATLTLPGIAGIVLTMGMSVDANVLIFERIKEELRDKKTTMAAVDQGFSQAFRTIIDSNITTLIVAFFLYAFGNGSVKGFAVTLSIGIVSSMFTAIILTRMIISLWLKSGLRKRKPKKLSLV